MMHQSIDKAVNTLAAFCGVRDFSRLTQESLVQHCGIAQVDVMVLFGGSILAGGDALAEAMQQQLAKKYIIVGGAGHTTQALRAQMQAELPTLQDRQVGEMCEAMLFDTYLRQKYGLQADYLECESTNCGNNIDFLLALLGQEGVVCQSILLMQDATMQRRMAATLRTVAAEMQIIQFAAYQAQVQWNAERLCYQGTPPRGMWEIEQYITLLMGEIPRLRDDEKGYGPKGCGYIAHEEIPAEVEHAFAVLQTVYTDGVRVANPAYASR